MDTKTPLTAAEDHNRVAAIPSYKRWHENYQRWCFDYERKQRKKADEMREAARLKYEAELERISVWAHKNVNYEAAYEAWSKIDDKKYWALRKV